MRTCLARECVLGCLTRLKGVLVLIWDQHGWEQMHLHRKSAYLFAFGRLLRASDDFSATGLIFAEAIHVDISRLRLS